MRPPARSPARIGLAVGVLVGALVLALVAVSIWPPLPERSTSGSSSVDGPVGTVDIDIGRGSLVVVGSASEELDVDHESSWRGWEPTVRVDAEDGVATVVADCPWRPILGSCSTDLHVVVPEGVHLRVDSEHGSVELRDLSGWVEVNLNGDLTATDIAGPELLATTGGGDVDVEFIEPPSRVDVDSSGGDIDLTIPGGPYEAELNGDPITNDVPTEVLAERLLTVDGGRGAVTIRSSDR